MLSECLNFKVRLSDDYTILTNNFTLKILLIQLKTVKDEACLMGQMVKNLPAV